VVGEVDDEGRRIALVLAVLFAVALFALQLPLPTFEFVLVVASLGVVDVQPATVGGLVLGIDAETVAGQVDGRIDGRFVDEPYVAEIFDGQTERSDLAAALEDLVQDLFCAVFGKAADEDLKYEEFSGKNFQKTVQNSLFYNLADGHAL
jgi:hypothetical protein